MPEQALPAVNIALPGKKRVVFINQFPAEWIADILIEIKTTV
jgi:hypothetical protein